MKTTTVVKPATLRTIDELIEPWTQLRILTGDLDDMLIRGVVPCGPADQPWHQYDAVDLGTYLGWDTRLDMWVEARGHSMVRRGIQHGSLVHINTRREPKAGDIVVANVYRTEFTLKRYEPPYLIGESYETIEIPIVPEMELRIIGVACGYYSFI